MMKLLVIFALVALIYAQDSKDAACRSLVKCVSDAEEARSQCDKQRKAPSNDKQKPQSGDECSTIGAKQEEIQNLQVQQRQQQRDCLTNSFADATPVGDKKKQEQCDKAVADYQQQPSVNAGVGAGANISTRVKRQGPLNVNSNNSIGVGSSSSGGSGGSSSGGSGSSSSGGPGGASSGAPGSSSSGGSGSSPSGSPSSSSGGSGKPIPGAPGGSSSGGSPGNNGGGGPKGNGSKGGKVNGTISGQGDKAAAAAKAAEVKQCFQNAEAKQKLCKDLYGCCSEMTPCDYKYHLSPLHSQIYQAQLDLYNLRKRCQKQQKGQPGPSASANSTISASMKGNPGKKPKDNQ